MEKDSDTPKKVLKIMSVQDTERAAVTHSMDLPSKSMNLMMQAREMKGGSPEAEEEKESSLGLGSRTPPNGMRHLLS